jgi:hypothetical protein
MGTGTGPTHARRTRRRPRARTIPARAAHTEPIAPLGITVGGATYDTGALVAAERNDRRMWALHAGFLAEEVVPTVPAPVLAEAWRGGARQASLARLLALCDVEPMSEEQARQVGTLAGKTDHHDVVDLTVVEGAIRRDDAIVTSDEIHIQRIADAVRARLRVEAI